MSSIDEKVVSAKFNNASFEANAKQTLGTLSALAKGFKLDNASKGLDAVSAAAKNANLGTLASAVDGLASKFSALSVMGVTALATIANKAVNAGLAMANSLTLQPIKAGFDEYELKMGSIQTILSNTARYGTKLPEVTKNLDALNNYADKTIYNFGDMTKNIGLFTNAGIKVGDATKMIQGFSNEAAASGTSAQGAASAAYQLSQALSAGKITLMDWRSLQNVGMGNKNMQNGLIEIASAMGTLNKHGTTAKKVQSDFNGSLQKGWLEAGVMSKYLKIMATDNESLIRKQLKQIGITGKQADAFVRQQKNAAEAATKVRTLTQLVGTIRESVGSSWTDTFDILVGDFNQATKLFTDINNTLGNQIGKFGDARNNLLKGWAKLGGRDVLIEGLKNGFQALGQVLGSIGKAFREVFPPTTAKQLLEMTKSFRDFTAGLKLGAGNADKLKRTFAGVFAIFKVVWSVVKGVLSVFTSLFGVVQGGGGGFLALTATVGDFLVKISDWLATSGRIKAFFDGIATARTAILIPLVNIFKILADAVVALAHGDIDTFKSQMQAAFKGLAPLVAAVQDRVTAFVGKIREATSAASDWLNAVGNNVSGKFQTAVGAISDGMAFISEQIQNAKDLLTGFSLNISDKGMKGASAGLGAMTATAERAQHVWDGLKKAFESVQKMAAPILGSLTNLFKTITDKLSEYIGGMDMQDAVALLNTGMFILMYKAIKDFMNNLSGLVDSFKDIAGSISGAFGQLTDTLKTMQKDVQANIILKIAVAIGILVAALYVLSTIDAAKLVTGLVAIGIMIKMLNMSMGYLADLKVADEAKIMSAAAGMVLMAVAIRILAGAVKSLADLDWQGLLKGLIGVGVLLTGLTLFTKYAEMDKGSFKAGAGLILMAVAIRILAGAVKAIGELDVGTITKGMTAITLLMGGMAVMTKVMNNTKGIFQAAAGMLVLSVAMAAMSVVLRIYAAMDWSTILKGLGAVTLSVAAIGLAMRAIPQGGSGQLLVAAAALVVLAGALKIIGSMSLMEIGKALIALSISLAAIVVAVNLLNGALPGAQALLIISASLLVFAGVMKILGSLSWEAIGKGLAAIAGFLVLLAIAGALMTPLIPTLIGLGVALQMLGQAMLLAGAGFLAFSIGFATLAAIGTAGFAVLIAGFMGLLNLIPLFAQQVGLGIRAFAVVIAGSLPQLTAAITTVILAILKAIETVIPRVIVVGLKVAMALLNAIGILLPKLYDTGLKIITGFLQAIANRIGPIIKAGADIIVNFLKGLAQQVPRITDQAAKTVIAFVNGTANAIRNNSAEMDSAGRNLATAILQGMARGLTSGVRMVVDAARGVAKSAIDAAKNLLGIHSPSREFAKLGKYSVEGFAVGLRGNKAAVDSVMKTMRSLISDTQTAIAKDVTAAEERLRKLNKAKKKDQYEIRKAKAALAQAKAEQKKVWAASALVKTYGDEQKKLGQLANSYDTVTTKLNDAKKALADAVKTRDDYAKSVQDQYDKLPDFSADTKLDDFVANLEKQITNTQIYTAQLQQLRKMGLNDAMYKELLAKGPDATAFAQQLLEGGQSAVDQVNTLGSALDAAAKGLGNTASKDLYQAGVDAAAGLVKGLEQQQAAIQKQMDKIATAMVNAIKKKLGIKSPSRESMKDGAWTVKGLVSGLQASSSLSEKAAADVGHSTINSLRKTLTGLKDVVGTEMDVNPTIRPVLDLTDVKRDSVKMGAMLEGQDLSVGSAYNKAKFLSNQYNSNTASRAQLEAVLAKPSVNFTQNNYSPKALTSATIYRNTNNQISKAKGALTT